MLAFDRQYPSLATLSPDECPLTFPEFDFNVWEKSISLNITGPGRISAYIAEIFGRDGRYDRGPNIVGFSFRYAPLGQYIRPAVVAPSPTRSLAAWLTPQAELLESMGIAWPPPPLWPQMSSLPVNTEITSGSMELTGEPISFPLHQVQAPTAFWPGLDVIPPSSILPDPSNVHVGPWPLGSFPDLSTASFDNGAPPPAMPLQVPDPFVENVGAEGPMMPYVPDVGGNNVGFMEAVATASLDQPDTPASVHNPINDNFPSHPCDFRLFLEPFVWEGDMPLDGLERKAGPECFDTLGPSACHYGDVGSWGGSVLQDIPPPKPSLGGSDEARTYGTDMQMRASAPQSEPVPVSGKRIHRRKAADANRGGATKRGGSIKLEPGSRIGRRALADGTGSPTITGRKRARPHDLAPDKLLQQRRKRGRPTAVSPTNKGDAASLDASQAVDSKRVLASPPIKNEPKDDILTGIRPTATV